MRVPCWVDWVQMRMSLLGVLLLGAALRLYDLDNPSPGVYRDEVIEGLHGAYHSRGQVATGSAWITFSRVPLWELLLTASVGILGPTLPALRLPAALCAIGAIWFVHDGLRRVAGRGPALLAAGLLATSFWNVLATRLGQPMGLAALQAATIWWLTTLSPGLPGTRTAIALGLIAGSGLLTYYGAFTLPVIACWYVWIRARSAPTPSPATSILRALLPLLVTAAAVGGLLLLRPDLLGTLHRSIRLDPVDIAGRLAAYLRVLAFPAPPESPDSGFWGIYPRGWPLLSAAESTLALVGLLGWRDPGPGRMLVRAAAGGLLLGFLPAATAPGLVFHRAPTIAIPVALLQAAGLLWIGARRPGWTAVLTAAALLLNAGWTIRTYFGVWRHDPMVELWADGVDTRVALDLKRRAAEAPFALANSLAYGDSPAIAWFLDREILQGRVRQVSAPVDPRWNVETVYRESLYRQPLIVLFRLHGTKSPVPVFLVAAPPVLLGAGDNALQAGDPGAAIAHYRSVLRLLPDYGIAHAKLARALDAAGLHAEAVSARAAAERLGVPIR